MSEKTPSALADLWRFVTFRASFDLFERLSLKHFLWGLGFTWLVGIARNWDFPDAPLFAKLGLPSVAYIFLLSFVFWLILWPISSEKRNYWHVLTAIAMTSPMGLIYGIPIEMIVNDESARNVNLAFLAIVAVWRLILAAQYFMRGCQCSGGGAFAAIFLPVTGILITLVFTGRAGYVFEIMGGINREIDSNSSVNDTIATLNCFAWLLLPVAVITYAVVAARVHSENNS